MTEKALSFLEALATFMASIAPILVVAWSQRKRRGQPP